MLRQNVPHMDSSNRKDRLPTVDSCVRRTVRKTDEAPVKCLGRQLPEISAVIKKTVKMFVKRSPNVSTYNII